SNPASHRFAYFHEVFETLDFKEKPLKGSYWKQYRLLQRDAEPSGGYQLLSRREALDYLKMSTAEPQTATASQDLQGPSSENDVHDSFQINDLADSTRVKDAVRKRKEEWKKQVEKGINAKK